MTPFFTSLAVICVLGISIGQLLFKKAATAIPPTPSLFDLAFNGWLLVAFALYGVTTLAWVWVLRSAPLYLAYPIMGLAFIVVPTLAWLFLNEPMHPKTIIGGLFIAIGITITSQAPH
ncbi:EamA family transporter [Delftia sp. WSY_7]|uniref:EamA family transporter n=1 Tax=Delftia sp. WSY_7 TaxID=3367202 RepID=UPI00370A1A4A